MLNRPWQRSDHASKLVELALREHDDIRTTFKSPKDLGGAARLSAPIVRSIGHDDGDIDVAVRARVTARLRSKEIDT